MRLTADCTCAALLICALAWQSAVATEAPKPIDWSLYRKKAAVFQEVSNIIGSQQSPKAMTVTSESGKEGNYSSTLSVVTVEPGGLKGDDHTKVRLLLNFGQHAREVIVVEMALRLLQLLADDRQLTAFCDQYGIAVGPLIAALRHTVIKIVPMENTTGRDRVEAGETCLRKNGRGVDPNRNWAVDWGEKEHDYNPEEEDPGTAPFSEPEAAMTRKLAEGFQPHVWVNVHSGMEALFMPYDHRPHIPEGDGPQAALAILERINHLLFGGRVAVGSGGKSVGYLAHGTATDYMFQELHVPLAFTWEIYGDENATFLECFRMFNPTTRKGMVEVVDVWTAAFFYLVLLLPKHPAVSEACPKLSIAIEDARKASEHAVNPLQGGKDSVLGGAPGSLQGMAIDIRQQISIPVVSNNSNIKTSIKGTLEQATALERPVTQQHLASHEQQQQQQLYDTQKSYETNDKTTRVHRRLQYTFAFLGIVAVVLGFSKRRSHRKRLTGVQTMPRRRAATIV